MQKHSLFTGGTNESTHGHAREVSDSITKREGARESQEKVGIRTVEARRRREWGLQKKTHSTRGGNRHKVGHEGRSPGGVGQERVGRRRRTARKGLIV